jgi:uncharacterized protein
MDEAPCVEVPVSRLSDELVTALIDDFVLREGTDYGHQEITLAAKRAQVRAQLHAGTAAILFEPSTETCTIVRRER